MFCPKCGKSNEDSSKFCQFCGSAFESVSVPKAGAGINLSFLLNFIAPYLAFIDNGSMFRRPFQWLYIILAALNIIWPFYVLYLAISMNVFQSPAKFIAGFAGMWLIMLIAGWISFQIWWDRSCKVLKTSAEGDDFVATPVFSHFIQTFGEWAGTYVAIVGFVFALLGTLVLGEDGAYLGQMLGLGFVKVGLIAIVLMPLYGFLIIVFARFLAETFRALVTIANNTKK
jgi:hypothetical protein